MNEKSERTRNERRYRMCCTHSHAHECATERGEREKSGESENERQLSFEIDIRQWEFSLASQ